MKTVKPPLETVVACVELLTRLARDSMFVVNRICECEELLEIVIENFVPHTFSSGKNVV